MPMVRYRDLMHVNHGNHKFVEANLTYGMCGNCTRKTSSQSFRLPSLCCLSHYVRFDVHVGMHSPAQGLRLPGQSHNPEDAIPGNVSFNTLDQISKIDRYTELQESS